MTAATVVEVRGLTVQFGSFTAVNNISFSVQRGEIFGFLGANGAGKTTTIRVLCGLLVPSAGEALIAGQRFEDGVDEIKKKVGYMSQRFTLYNDLTVRENLEFAAALRKIDTTTFNQRSQQLFSFIGFNQSPTTLVRDLPGGIKQELSLAAALLHEPEIVFLDEPTAGVSPGARARFWSLIRRLAGEGRTIFVTTHYMDEAEQCGRMALMSAGNIIALGTPAELKTKAFPEPLYELEPVTPGDVSWKTDFDAAHVGEARPHGMRYHVSPSTREAWSAFAARWATQLRTRRIDPSLEDVFLKMVER